jgi:hypothetical protein
VTVVTTKQQYQPTEVINVAVANGLSSQILVADHQSSCTIVVVEYLAGQTRQPQNLCQLKSPTRLVPIAADTALNQQVHPPMVGGGAKWPSGTYRVQVAYRLSTSGQDTVIYSPQFTVA